MEMSPPTQRAGSLRSGNVMGSWREDWTSMWRRRGRTLLTVAGMACGVFALVLMAAVAEHFDGLARHFTDAFSGRLYVCEKLSFWAGGGIIDEDKAAETAQVRGVGEVIPVIIGRLQSQRMVVVGLPMVLVGVPPAQARRLWHDAPLAEGRMLGIEDEAQAHALLGSDVAHAFGARPGSRLRALAREWTVVGVLAHTGALEDRQMLVPLRLGQEVLGREGLITSMVVTPSASTDLARLAPVLRAALPRLEVVEPARLDDEVENGLRLWRALILACGLIAAATGTLCVVITMTVSVTERTHEIGLKKALGASNGQVVGEVLTESALVAGLGWAVGTLAAAAFVGLWDASFRQEGMFLFHLSARVIGGSAVLTLLFGLLAGSLPALSAARLDPVAALRRRG